MRSSIEILDMPVTPGSVMPVVWTVVAVEGAGSDARVHLQGKLVRVLIMDDVPETIKASIPMSRVKGGVYFVQPGAIMVSVPSGSDWLDDRRIQGGAVRDSKTVSGPFVASPIGFGGYEAPPSTSVSEPVSRGNQVFTGSFVTNINNHVAFFLTSADSYGGKVEFEIMKGIANRGGVIQILLGRPASPRIKETLRSRGMPSVRADTKRRYHPYVDEFEVPIMSEWVEHVPPIMPVPELIEDESYTLIGFVTLHVPPHSIEIRREHEVETQPVLRSSTLHKAPRANLTHDWVMNFIVTGEDINTRLVPLLRQIDRCPFLPITNVMFNQAGIFEIVVDQVEVTTMPDHPNSLQVTLSGRKFDTGGLGFELPFALNFNWPLFKLFTDYLPRFLPVTLPMDGKIRILSPSDSYIFNVLNRAFDESRIAERIGFAPQSGTGGGDGINVPPELVIQPGSGQFVLLPLPDDPTRVGRYEAVVANDVASFRQLAQAVINNSVPGLEARSVTVVGGDVFLSRGTLPISELERLLSNVDSGKQGIVKSALESVAFCWRLDSIGRVRTADLDRSLSRLLNATFSSAGSRRRASRTVSSGTRRPEAPVADMEPFLPEGVNVVWQSVSVGFGNIVAALRRDVGDPVMQYLGKTDVTIVLNGVADSEGLTVLRSLFDRYISIAYMLRGLSFIQPVRLNFQIDNEIARLMGVEEVIPISLDVRNMEGTPDAYTVSLTFVTMDPGGVQRRAMRRLSENVTRQERMFNMTYSGIDASRELDRLYASLRRSELYPDLRLPTYGLLIDWCRTLAYQNGLMWDFVKTSLRGLAPGLDEDSYRQYLNEVSQHMKAFLNRIHNSGLMSRMSRYPYIFADPDFYFHDGNGISSMIRRSIQREISAGGQTDAVFVDDTGVTGSISQEDGTLDVRIHQSTSELSDTVKRSIQNTAKRQPALNHHSGAMSEISSLVLNDIVDTVGETSGLIGDDVISASSKQQIEAYRSVDVRFREAFAIPESELLFNYRHDVRDDSVERQISARENSHLSKSQEISRSINSSYASLVAPHVSTITSFGPVREAQSVPSGMVVDGVKKIVDAAVNSLLEQASRPSASRTFTLSNAATDQSSPATWSVIWKPSQFGLTVRFLRMAGVKLKPFVMGMFEQESSFNPQARSASAVGLAQFTPETWRGLLTSGRFSVSLVKFSGSTAPDMVETRWDLAAIMGIYYFIELIIDGVMNIVGKDKDLRDDFATFICADSPAFRSRVLADPLSVFSGDERMCDRLMVLGACLYNAGPQSLRRVLSQLADNVRAGKRGSESFSVTRTDPGHGRYVYDKYVRWQGLFVDTVHKNPPSHPQELRGAISPWISQQTNVEFTRQYMERQRSSGPSNMAHPTASHRASRTGDPFNDVHNLKNFPLLPLTGWADTARYQPHGRFIQCFPTYCLLLVQGGRWVRWHRFWDHFYGLFSVMSIDVHKSRESPQHTAEIILSNSYRQLSNLPVTQAYAQAVIAGMRPFQQVQGEELFRGGGPESEFVSQLVKSIQNYLFPLLGEYERHVWNQELKALFLHPGERIHLRIGYGADAASLPVVFNGTIASVDIQGSVIRMLALGDGREFLKDIATEGQPYKNSNLFGQTVEIRNILVDMLVARRADSVPVIGPIVYTFSAGGFMNDSRFGIESFGRIETLAGSSAMADAASGNWSIRTFKLLGMAGFQAGEGEVGVNLYNSQRDSGNYSIGMLPLLDTLTMGLSQLARNGDFIAIELKQGTIWDVFRNCQLAMLDALMSVEPFGLRSTLFFGRAHQALHYDYYSAPQLEALGVRDLASRIAFGSYWRIMRFKQYRQYHLAVSDWNLISNELTATTEKMWNEVQSFDAQGVPGNKFTFDPAVVPEDRKPFYFHSALSTTLMSQLMLGAESNWVSVLGRIGFIRNLVGERLGIAMPIRAVNNVSANLVREGISYMYDGSLVMVGAAEIKPYDMIFIEDQLRAMRGPVIVREVEHHFSTQHGYSTLVVPDACVLGVGDIENSNLVMSLQVATNIFLYCRLRKDLIVVYRGYLFLLLNALGFAMARIRYLTQKIPLVNKGFDRFMAMLGSLSKTVKPSFKDVRTLFRHAWRASRGVGRDFFGTLFHGAWNIQGFKQLAADMLTHGKYLLGAIIGRDGALALNVLSSALNRLASLGAVRPLLSFRAVGSAIVRTVGTRANLILMVGGTVLEMVNRKLSSFYPCRLYPVHVNRLPLTAGIRGHFGTVQGDSPSPLQRVIDAVTIQSLVTERMPSWFGFATDLLRAVWPVTRHASTYVANDEELRAAQSQPSLRSRYDMLGMFGSVSEIYGGNSPTLREPPNEHVVRKPFRRSMVGYARNDDPTKGDYLLDYMDGRASPILRDLLQTLRSRGVQVAIHQGRRTLEEQQRLYEQLQAGRRSKAVAKPTPSAPHVAGRAIDVQYRHPDGSFRSSPPASQESIILQVVAEMNRKYAPAKVRWLGDRSRYSGSVYEPWHFDVLFGGG